MNICWGSARADKEEVIQEREEDPNPNGKESYRETHVSDP